MLVCGLWSGLHFCQNNQWLFRESNADECVQGDVLLWQCVQQHVPS